MPKSPSDLWCPNCAQLVRPHVRLAASAWLIGIAIWIGGGFGMHFLFGSSSGLIALAIGVFVARTWGARVRSCPMCRSQSLADRPSNDAPQEA
jgi:hypothetical protein